MLEQARRAGSGYLADMSADGAVAVRTQYQPRKRRRMIVVTDLPACVGRHEAHAGRDLSGGVGVQAANL